jgi:hypothetical protein
MATTASAPPTSERSNQGEIKLYSHSPIFYWWPVWLVGFIMAFLTYLDGGRMAIVPGGTEARRDWQVQVAPNHVETREGLILPRSNDKTASHLAPTKPVNPDGSLPTPNDPHVRMAHSQYLGTWFFITFLIVFISSNVPLRGLWEWIGVLFIALVVSILLLYGWWGTIVDWFSLLHVRINLAGYVFLSVWMFAIWTVSVFFFDTRTYIIVSSGQVRVRSVIGEGEKVYDVTNMTFQLQPNILFRHRVLGFYGAGDLIVRTGGPNPEVLEWPNVLFVRSRLRQIEQRLKARMVV